MAVTGHERRRHVWLDDRRGQGDPRSRPRSTFVDVCGFYSFMGPVVILLVAQSSAASKAALRCCSA